MSFTPVTRVSRNVTKSLRDFAYERKIELGSLDFQLIAYETLIKRSGENVYEVLDKTEILCEDELLDPLLEIIQEYTIRIMPKEECKTLSNIILGLAADKHRVKAVATLMPGSVLAKHKGVLKEFRDAVWKKKLLAGLFIDFFESNLVDQLKKMVTLIPLDKPIGKEIKFSVGNAIAVEPPIDAKLILDYEIAQKSKTFIDGMGIGEKILTYLKPKPGVDGRGCDGLYIKVREPRAIDPKPKIDATIRESENEDSVEYFTAIDGYVLRNNDSFSISKKLMLQSANFKSTGLIDTGEDKDIAVHIGDGSKKSDDAITSGVKIDVRELNVNGSVGSNVNINATDLNIAEQTHRNSKIEVSNVANIRLHKGDLSAKEANIEILEAGKVTAQTSISIGQMLGGEAIAPIVRVDEVLSNCVIIASELIEIKSIRGSGVKLIIDPQNIEAHHVKIEENKEKIKSLSAQIYAKKEQLAKDIKEHQAGAERIKKFQLKVLQAQKAGQEPIKQDLIRLRQYKKNGEELKLKESALQADIAEVENCELDQERLYKQDLHGQIIHHGEYDGHTQVVFINPKTQEKVVSTPTGRRETITAVIGSKGREIRFS
jgi:hypothetical protein